MRLFTKAFLLVLAAHSFAAAEATQQRFPSPEAAMHALDSALREKKTDRVEAILGPESGTIISSGDAVDDESARQRFLAAAGKKTRIEQTDDGMMAVVHLGDDDWPFPIPLVRDGNEWRFDTPAGKEELLNRRIGRNEIITISACRAYVDEPTGTLHERNWPPRYDEQRAATLRTTLRALLRECVDFSAAPPT